MDVVTHLPRAPVSEGSVDIMRWLLESNGVSDVPSLNKLKSSMTDLDKQYGPQIRKHMGAHGHTYYTVSLANQIAMVKY